MKICKTVHLFILLFTGYICNNIGVAGNTTASSHILSPEASEVSREASEVTQAADLKTPPHRIDYVPEKHLSALLVAGVSISFLFLLILVMIGVWCAQKKSKGNLSGINAVYSDEPGVSLQRISTHDNQHEWPFQSALQ
ncbi:uncharacterized protein RG961_002536 isoform 1-T3 [Leptosomus discolor]